MLKKFVWKFFFYQSEHVSSQIWCQKFFPLLGGGSPPPKKVAQNELKHILVLEFLRSNDLCVCVGGGCPSVRYKRTDTRHSDQIRRSARRDGATKKKERIIYGVKHPSKCTEVIDDTSIRRFTVDEHQLLFLFFVLNMYDQLPTGKSSNDSSTCANKSSITTYSPNTPKLLSPHVDNNNGNKKVLLRERKRHTARRVAVASACYSGGWVLRVPPHLDLGWGTPHLDLGWGNPPPHLDLRWGTPLPRLGTGYPPPRVWTDKLKTVPSCHPSDAGGNK